MKELKASTKAGQNIIERARTHQGYKLSDVYGSYSRAKEDSFEWCLNEFRNTENASDFHICSHCINNYSVAWVGTYNGEEITRLETKDNTYIVYMNK